MDASWLTTPLDNWTLAARKEPTIRIGIVLPEDGMTTITLRIPAQGYALTVDGQPGPRIPSVTAEAQVTDRGVLLRWPGGTAGPAGIISLSPTGALPLARGAGIELHDIITGRGFHWQKRMNAALTGAVEFRVHDGRLLVVNEVLLENYLTGVITSEMSGECPVEFLKSQCVVARSWVLARTEPKHPGLPIHRCNDDCCQRYHGTADLSDNARRAVTATRGQILVDDRKRIIDANYSKSCGGIIEAPEHVWSVSKPGLVAAVDAPKGSVLERFLPVTEGNLHDYLAGDWVAEADAFCSPNVVPVEIMHRYLGKVDETTSYFRWRQSWQRGELEDIIRTKTSSRPHLKPLPDFHTLMDLRVARRGESGRANLLHVDYLDPAGARRTATIETEYNIRDLLHPKFLYSSAIEIHITRDDAGLPRTIELLGAGWGHGVGLCQIGALGMALKGHDCSTILHHYFRGIEIHSAYS